MVLYDVCLNAGSPVTGSNKQIWYQSNLYNDTGAHTRTVRPRICKDVGATRVMGLVRFPISAQKKYASLDEVCFLVFQGLVSYSSNSSGMSLAAGCYPVFA